MVAITYSVWQLGVCAAEYKLNFNRETVLRHYAKPLLGAVLLTNSNKMTINSFDELTSFKDGEDDKYIVEYVLADDGGFCHRCSPFLLPKGTIFEHNYGTYEVVSIDRKVKHIVLHCERIDNKTPMFDVLFKIREQFN